MTDIPAKRDLALAAAAALLAACAEEPQPPSVQELMDNPILLEATVLYCAENRNLRRYDAECVNAHQAVSIIEARDERARYDALEVQSERKREELRQIQEATAEARRRAADAARLQQEVEYHAQFGEQPPDTKPEEEEPLDANVPGAVLPARDTNAAAVPSAGGAGVVNDAGSNAPGVRTEPAAPESGAPDDVQ